MITKTFVGVVACCGAIGTAQAQHPLVMQRLTAINAASPAPTAQIVREQIAQTAAALYPTKPGCAKTGLTIEQVVPAAAERFIFNGAIRGQIKNGWTATVRHPACDDAPVRYMIVQDASGALRTTRVNRGISYAHDSLIADTFPLAVLAAEAFLRRSGSACDEPKDAKLGVVRIEDQASDLGPDVMGVRYKGSWTEVWPIALCGATVEVPVAFTADGDGGAYTNMKGALIKRTSAPATPAAAR